MLHLNPFDNDNLFGQDTKDMSVFTPGSFKQSLQNKVNEKSAEAGDEELKPFAIKKTDPNDFRPRASDYHARDQGQGVRGQGTAVLPKDSPINKSVHERMKSFVKEQYGK